MTGVLRANTFLFRSHIQLQNAVNRLREKYNNNTLLFSLSHNTPELEQAVRYLNSFSDETLGCLSCPLPIENDSSVFSCAIAIFDKGSALPFSTIESGYAPVRVGRARSYQKNENEAFERKNAAMQSHNISNWDTLWGENHSIELPKELKNQRSIQSFVYFTGNTSWGLGNTLHSHFPNSYQLGMIASSTPFVTGRPNTLFRNGNVQSLGAVGVALLDKPLRSSLRFNGLVRLTDPLPVRRAEGNLIHELGESLPARILLKSIQDHGLSDESAKDVDFFISTKSNNSEHSSPDQLLRVVAGSPSKGSIAVEEVPAPTEGTEIQFYYRPKSCPVSLPYQRNELTTEAPTHSIGSIVCDIDHFHQDSMDQERIRNHGVEDPQLYSHTFLNVSEHGFVLSSQSQNKFSSPWRCSVPGSFAELQFTGF